MAREVYTGIKIFFSCIRMYFDIVLSIKRLINMYKY